MLLCLPIWGFLPYLGIDKSVAESGEAGDLRTLCSETATRLEHSLTFTGAPSDALLGGSRGAEHASNLLFLRDGFAGLTRQRTEQLLCPSYGLEAGTGLLRADASSS